MNDIVTWAANSDLENLISAEYLLMAFFAIGAFTSSNNRNKKIFTSNLATLVTILLVFFFRGLLAYAAQRFNAVEGPALAGVIRNDVFRLIFNAVLLSALLYRMVKTCWFMRLRELDFARIMNFRKRRIPNA